VFIHSKSAAAGLLCRTSHCRAAARSFQRAPRFFITRRANSPCRAVRGLLHHILSSSASKLHISPALMCPAAAAAGACLCCSFGQSVSKKIHAPARAALNSLTAVRAVRRAAAGQLVPNQLLEALVLLL
jgi:hypothetical protein